MPVKGCGGFTAAKPLRSPRAEMTTVRVGCSGWNYDHWRNGVLYPPRCPPREWLDYYARHFDTVEVNATFYRLPRRDAVANWVRTTPPGFVFAVKMSRYVTHIRRLRDPAAGVRRFYERIAPLVRSPKLGPVLWQLPGNFRRDDELLAEALALLPRGRHCFEFRHESWFAPEVYELLRSAGAALVIGDDPRRWNGAYTTRLSRTERPAHAAIATTRPTQTDAPAWLTQ